MAHETLTFSNPLPVVQHNGAKWSIQAKRRWEDEWYDVTNVRLDYVAWALAPSLPRAQFTERYGFGMQPGETQFTWQTRLAIERQYVKIKTWYVDRDGGEVPGWTWVGICEGIGDSHDGIAEIPAYVVQGEQTFMMYGLMWLLDQHRIETSAWKLDGDRDLFTAQSGLTFNQDGEPNRSPEKHEESHYVFSDNRETASHWSTRDIVEYLVRSGHGTPRDNDGNEKLPFTIADEELDKLPTWDTPEVESAYVSTAALLTSLISRRRLVTWWLEYDEEAESPGMAVKITTFNDEIILVPEPDEEGQIPANPNTLDIDLTYDSAAEVALQAETEHKVDQVVAYGARRRNICTIAFDENLFDPSFQKGWDTDQQGVYELAGANDAEYPAASEIAERRRWHARARGREEVKPVFRKFVITPTWQIDPANAYPVDDFDNYTQNYDTIRIDPILPFVDGVDYSGFNLIYDTLDKKGQGPRLPRPPLVVIKVPGETDKYVRIQDIGKASLIEQLGLEDIRTWSADVRVPKDGKTLEIDVYGAPQHAIAYGTFNPRSEDLQEHGQWDWRTCMATVALLDDRYAEGRYPADDDVEETDAKRVIRVRAGATYRQDFVAEDTVADLTDSGTLKKVSLRAYVQDDTPKLRSIAQAAYAWYSRTRRAMQVSTTFYDPAEKIKLGHYVRSILRAGVQYPVESVVSEIVVRGWGFVGDEPRADLPPLKVTIHTAFGELDYARLA